MLKKFTQFQFLSDPDLSHFFKLFSGFICNRYNEAEETNIYKQVSREAVKGRALWRVWHPFKCSLNTQLPFYRILQDPHFTTEKENEEISWDLWAGCLTFWRCWLRVPLVACDNSVTIVLLYVMSETIVSVIVITANWKIPATAVTITTAKHAISTLLQTNESRLFQIYVTLTHLLRGNRRRNAVMGIKTVKTRT